LTLITESAVAVGTSIAINGGGLGPAIKLTLITDSAVAVDTSIAINGGGRAPATKFTTSCALPAPNFFRKSEIGKKKSSFGQMWPKKAQKAQEAEQAPRIAGLGAASHAAKNLRDGVADYCD